MNRKTLQDNWSQFQESFQRNWEKLTADDIEFAQGSLEALSDALQVRYGISKSQAESELESFMKSIDQPT